MDYTDIIVKETEALVNIPSPSGFTKKALEYVEKKANEYGFETEYLNKGGLVIKIPGNDTGATRGISAHVDTLGAMVRSINKDGTLRFVAIGGFMMQTIESNYCRVHTRDGRTYTGTILSTAPSVHVHDDARSLERVEKNMCVRLDEIADSAEDVRKLGIETGDYISFDPMFVACESGYVKSRHLDDKASVAVILTFLKYLKDTGKKPATNVLALISNYEEIGFGASYLPEEISEFLAIDMGAVGEDLEGNERKVSICAKDSSGPYDYEFTGKLIDLAKKNNIPYAVDVFPHYGSDASAAIKGGNNIKAALIGQGVQASHNIERTHREGLLATFNLLKAYMEV
ncbi:MAG: M42 family metallopeptidase [Lachnospiraceae bacterium]|nr:M42 family metallopeptidase [Lachnospiraceae bacterium]